MSISSILDQTYTLKCSKNPTIALVRSRYATQGQSGIGLVAGNHAGVETFAPSFVVTTQETRKCTESAWTDKKLAMGLPTNITWASADKLPDFAGYETQVVAEPAWWTCSEEPSSIDGLPIILAAC